MDLTTLLELQKIDYKIMDVEASIGDLPEKVNTLREKNSSMKNELQALKQDLSDVTSQKNNVEIETKVLYEKLKKYQEQVYNVTTNKEYDAISNEIENSEKAIEENETKILELLESEEQLTEKIKKMEESVKQAAEEFEEKEQLLKERIEKSKDRHQQLLAKRQTIAEKLDKRILTTYERIRNGRNGVALAEIKNYTCGECFATIPPQTVVEIRQMNRIILCETCGRILISTNSVHHS